MHLRTSLILQCLAVNTFAETYRLQGSKSDLKVTSLAEGDKVTSDIYKGCEEIVDGKLVSVGRGCVAKVLAHMTEAVIDAHEKNEKVVALVNNTVNDARPAHTTSESVPASQTADVDGYGTDVKRGESDKNLGLREMKIGRPQKRSTSESGLRTRHIGRSDLHLDNGLAVRTNVQSGDDTLHVHQNGSHITALFQRDASTSKNPQDDASPLCPDFQFYGVQGLKLQLRRTQDAEEGSMELSDLQALLRAFAYGNGETEPRLKLSDSWSLATCQKSDGAMLLQGKVISLMEGATYNFEEDGLIDCKD